MKTPTSLRHTLKSLPAALSATLSATLPATLLVAASFHPASASAQDAPTHFEVATFKLSQIDDPAIGSWSPPGIGRFWAQDLSLTQIVQLAFGMDKKQIANAPAWMESTHYTIEAKPEAGVLLSRQELQPCLQALLAERLHLAAHHETRLLAGYALRIAKHGAHLQAAEAGHTLNFRANTGSGHLDGYNWTMPFCALMLTPKAGAPVVDRTGLTGHYDVHLTFAPDLTAESDLPSLFTALRDSLGLELKAGNVPVDFVVVDHIDRIPTEN